MEANLRFARLCCVVSSVCVLCAVKSGVLCCVISGVVWCISECVVEANLRFACVVSFFAFFFCVVYHKVLLDRI